jgi:hypothetical protein
MKLMILVGYFTKYDIIFNFIEIDEYVEVRKSGGQLYNG